MTKEVRTCCVVSKSDIASMHKTYFCRSKAPFKSHWNQRKTHMYLVLGNNTLTLQLKKEEHAGGKISYNEISIEKMMAVLLRKYPVKKNDFEKGTDDKTKEAGWWITDNVNDKRRLVLEKPVIAYKKVKMSDGTIKSERIKEEVYIAFNDIKQHCRR